MVERRFEGALLGEKEERKKEGMQLAVERTKFRY